MEVIEITHPIQAEQYIQEDVAMALGFFRWATQRASSII